MIANVRCIAAALALSAPLATPAVAATWSDTFLGYRYGTRFHEPNNTQDVRKHVLRLLTKPQAPARRGLRFFIITACSSLPPPPLRPNWKW